MTCRFLFLFDAFSMQVIASEAPPWQTWPPRQCLTNTVISWLSLNNGAEYTVLLRSHVGFSQPVLKTTHLAQLLRSTAHKTVTFSPLYAYSDIPKPIASASHLLLIAG